MYTFKRYRQIGFEDFNQPFVPSLLIEFRKRLNLLRYLEQKRCWSD